MPQQSAESPSNRRDVFGGPSRDSGGLCWQPLRGLGERCLSWQILQMLASPRREADNYIVY